MNPPRLGPPSDAPLWRKFVVRKSTSQCSQRPSVARAISEQPEGIAALWRWALLPRAIAGMIALICGNVYIVGINEEMYGHIIL